jgi:molecular chaperone DnaJ
MDEPQRDWFEKDFYAVLGVAEQAGAKEVTKAYRKLARQLHPDKNPGDHASEERFKEVSAAYEVIGDKDRRASYDEVRAQVKAGRMNPPRTSAAGNGPQWTSGGTPGGFSFEDGGLSDLFSGLFNQAGATGAQPPGGGDIEAALTLSFDDAVAGTTINLTVTAQGRCTDCSGSGAQQGETPRTCATCGGQGVTSTGGMFSFTSTCTACGGSGVVIEHPCASCAGAGVTSQTHPVKVRVPQGVRDGQRIKVTGHGHAGADGRAGDLYVRVAVTPHHLFGRVGNDLTVTVPITYSEAALGANVKVPCYQGGPVTIKVPAGTPNGKGFKVRGRGVATKQATGDLLVTVTVSVPTGLSDEQRTALEALASVETSPRVLLGV